MPTIHSPAINHPVNVIGAGDTFLAGLLCSSEEAVELWPSRGFCLSSGGKALSGGNPTRTDSLRANHMTDLSTKPSEGSLRLEDYYLAAKNLRSELMNADPEVQQKAAARFTGLVGFETLPLEQIPSKKISLNQAKQVIAQEASFENWGQLKVDLSQKVEAIQQQAGNLFVPGEAPNSTGDVVSNDIIILGTFNDKLYAVDAILLDLYELKPSQLGPGYEVIEMDPVEFEPESIPDIPDEEDQWEAWGVSMAQALGLS